MEQNKGQEISVKSILKDGKLVTGTPEEILDLLKKIHKDTFEFVLEDEKIVLIKRLKPQTKHGVVCIPEEIDIIGEKALANQEDIIKIIFPGHQIEVRKMACINCANLESISFLNASKVGDFVFAGCTALEEITESRADVLGTGVFLSDINLKKLDFKYSSAGYACFENCLKLK